MPFIDRTILTVNEETTKVVRVGSQTGDTLSGIRAYVVCAAKTHTILGLDVVIWHPRSVCAKFGVDRDKMRHKSVTWHGVAWRTD